MTDYLYIDGVAGPVKTAQFLGAFECYYLTNGIGPQTMYASIHASTCRPALFAICARETLINKIVFNSMEENSSNRHISAWNAVIIKTVYPEVYPSGHSYLNFAVDLEFSYRSIPINPVARLRFPLPPVPVASGAKAQSFSNAASLRSAFFKRV